MLSFDPKKPAGGLDKPFRVRYYDDVIDESTYDRLLATFPDEGFRPLNAVGKKFSLNDRDENFGDFLRGRPEWQQIHRWFKNNMARMASETIGVDSKRGAVRFEFSSLPADDGGLYPHPDTKKKVATAVFYMEPDWEPEWGGGFEALIHNTEPDADWTDRRPDWSEVHTAMVVPVAPRRILFMQRTNNSLHGVRPLHAERPRRSVTVNLIG